MNYQVIVPKSVQKQINQIPNEIAGKILSRLSALESDPRPPNVKKLKGRMGWRIRVGDYRVLYTIQDTQLIITLIAVGHRREIYR